MNNVNLVSVLTNLVKIKTLLFKETTEKTKGSDRIALAIEEAVEGICTIGNMLVENGEIKCGNLNSVLEQGKESKNVNDTIRVKEEDSFNRIERLIMNELKSSTNVFPAEIAYKINTMPEIVVKVLENFVNADKVVKILTSQGVYYKLKEEETVTADRLNEELKRTLSKDSNNVNVSGGEDYLTDSKKVDRSLELKVLNYLKSYFDCPEYGVVFCADEIANAIKSKEIKPVQEALDNLVKTKEASKFSGKYGTYYAYNG